MTHRNIMRLNNVAPQHNTHNGSMVIVQRNMANTHNGSMVIVHRNMADTHGGNVAVQQYGMVFKRLCGCER